MKKIFVLGLLTMAVLGAGCTNDALTRHYNKDSGVPMTDRYTFHFDTESRLKTLAKEGYEIDVVRVEDRRVPGAFINDPEDNVLYEYRPDKLMRGVVPYVEALLGKYGFFGEDTAEDKAFIGEVTLTELSTKIMTGNFVTGRFGHYQVHIRADVVVRNKKSIVIVNEPMEITYTMQREAYTGRHPSTKQDEKRMMEAIENAFQAFAVEMGWNTRRQFISAIPGVERNPELTE